MKKLISFVLSCSVFVTGCATTYQGPPPNFKLRGEEAKAEYEKFHWGEDAWGQGPGVVLMGPDRKITSVSSLEPVIKEVSPEILSEIKKARMWKLADTIVVSGLLLWLFTNGDKSVWSDRILIASGGLALTSAINFVIIPNIMDPAINQFNRDLKQKFEPGVALQTSF